MEYLVDRHLQLIVSWFLKSPSFAQLSVCLAAFTALADTSICSSPLLHLLAGVLSNTIQPGFHFTDGNHAKMRLCITLETDAVRREFADMLEGF